MRDALAPLRPKNCANNLATSRIENSSGDSLDPLNAGPAAQNVPARAVTVDDSSPEVIYHDSLWQHGLDYVHYYDRSVSYTDFRGSSLSYAFDGVAIWYDYLSYTIH